MKAISVRHPWIDLILDGRKTVELRGRATRHRGELHLHASRTFGPAEREAATRLGVPAPEPGQLGVVLGKVRLVDCRKVTPADWAAALAEPRETRPYAWLLAKPKRVKPFPAKGSRVLFEIQPG
jgi:ASCH domain-containing protein